MSITTEIKNKEKSLAELMVRVLKEPLTPLEDSIKVIHDGILDTKELIEDINNAVGASACDVDKVSKAINKQFIPRSFLWGIFVVYFTSALSLEKHYHTRRINALFV